MAHLPLPPVTTLEDLGCNQGGMRSTIRATHIQLVPTQGCQEL